MKALIAFVAALVLAGSAAAACKPKTSLLKLENEVMCPVCAGETLAQSDTAAAQQVKQLIQRRVQACWSEADIKRELAADYGPQILAAPPRHGFDLLAWVLPLVGILGATAVMGVLAWRWSRRRDEPPDDLPAPQSLNGRPLDPELERRLDEELARFDG
jgi:cytochrome c-type biogenesis protein CcmH